MRVLLVQPPGSNWIPGKRDVSAIVSRTAPLGLLSIASYLRARRHSVLICDTYGLGYATGLELVIRTVRNFQPAMVGLTATTSAIDDASAFCRQIKRLFPEVLTVLGGVHATAVGAALLDEFPSVDLLVLGEGEETMAELASAAPIETIHGIAFRHEGKPRTSPPRQQIQNLDNLPFPDHSFLDGFPLRYPLPLFGAPASRGATIVTSRGCPYRCSFCVRSVFGSSYRVHSPDYIYEHAAQLSRKYGIQHLNIADDLFTLDAKRVIEFCELLIRRPLGLTMNCSVRAGHVNTPMLRALKRAGCWMISLGIESGDPELLSRHKPGVRLERIRETVQAIKNAGLKVKGLFIAGLPGETPGTLQRTSDFMISLDLDDMNLTRFTPFPGAPSWPELSRAGLISADRRLMNCNNTVYLPPGFRSEEQFDFLYRQAVRRFYSQPRWRTRFLRRAWQCRSSFPRLLRHLPTLLSAQQSFRTPKSLKGPHAPPSRGEE
ncbi:MAG: radical SAM protein [Acidobacteriota bacterium]|nr:radical SAM protein [Acidobacteriota bacterium]